MKNQFNTTHYHWGYFLLIVFFTASYFGCSNNDDDLGIPTTNDDDLDFPPANDDDLWVAVCGDGLLQTPEVCDDGDLDNCTVACNADCSGVGNEAVCGDGKVECEEVCDDGDIDNCTFDCNATCSGSGTIPVCGDGVVECGEVCDDGNITNCDGCSSSCLRVDDVCGDGVVECGEACDDGNVSHCDQCTRDCTRKGGICGDGIMECGEQCDDGDTDNCNECKNDCNKWGSICGNRIQECDEVCDDGNQIDCDGCASDCLSLNGLCGNGKIECSETCDDGVHNGFLDACNLICTEKCGPVASLSTRFGDVNEQILHSMAVDDNGNVWLTGQFKGTVHFGGNQLVSAGDEDAFLAKLDSSGRHIHSARFGSFFLEERGESVVTDKQGNVWLSGQIGGITVDFGGGPLPANDYNSSLFLAKFDPTGGHLFSKRFDNIYESLLLTDHNDDVWMLGNFNDVINLGGSPLVSSDPVWHNLFIAKLSSTGAHLFSFGLESRKIHHLQSATLDDDGNLWITGTFRGDLNFGGGVLNSAGDQDIFLAKYDPDGKHLFSTRLGDEKHQFAKSITVDSKGEVWLMGYFGGTLSLDEYSLTSKCGLDIFIAKFDPVGKPLFSSSFEYSCAIPSLLGDVGYGRVTVVDKKDNLWLSNEYRPSGESDDVYDFGGGPLTNPESSDIFLVKFAPDGSHLYSTSFNDKSNQSEPMISISQDGDMWMAGNFHGTFDFGDELHTSAGSSDIYLVKFKTFGAQNCYHCGDGVLDPSEACDDGELNGSGLGLCLQDCSGIQ